MIMTWRQQERLLAELIGPNETHCRQAAETVLAATEQRTAI